MASVRVGAESGSVRFGGWEVGQCCGVLPLPPGKPSHPLEPSRTLSGCTESPGPAPPSEPASRGVRLPIQTEEGLRDATLLQTLLGTLFHYIFPLSRLGATVHPHPHSADRDEHPARALRGGARAGARFSYVAVILSIFITLFIIVCAFSPRCQLKPQPMCLLRSGCPVPLQRPGEGCPYHRLHRAGEETGVQRGLTRR